VQVRAQHDVDVLRRQAGLSGLTSGSSSSISDAPLASPRAGAVSCVCLLGRQVALWGGLPIPMRGLVGAQGDAVAVPVPISEPVQGRCKALIGGQPEPARCSRMVGAQALEGL
jgi:hypothetical protein